MKKEYELKGRWLKALVDNPVNIPMKKGEYALIESRGILRFYFKSFENWSWSESQINNIFQLMPEGFNPNKTINNYYFY